MFQVSCFKCCSHLNPETWNLAKRKCLSATQSAIHTLAVGLGDLVPVTFLRDVTHVDERGVDNQLVEVNVRFSDNQAERLDEKFPPHSGHRAGISNVEVRSAAYKMLRLAGSVNDNLVQLLAAEPAGDDHRQSQLLAQRFEGVDAQPPQVLHRLRRWHIRDAVLPCRGALGELPQREVRCQNSVVFHKRTYKKVKH